MSWIMTLNTIFLCFIEILNSVKNLQAFVRLCFWPMGIQMYQEGRSHKIARKVIMLLEIPSLRSYPHWYTFLLQKLKHLGRKRKSPGKTGNLQTLLFEKQTLPSPPTTPSPSEGMLGLPFKNNDSSNKHRIIALLKCLRVW